RDKHSNFLYPTWNQSVRTGLTHALAQHPSARTLQVHLAWFADRPGDGVASIDDAVELPREVAGYLGVRAAASVTEEFLAPCAYSPGLDLWDPLGEGLKSLIGRGDFLHQSNAAVLIVGNSP